MNFHVVCRRAAHALVVCAFAVALAISPAFAQRDLKNIPDPDPEIERKTFVVPDGFEVNLYAADPLLAKPIQMNFDAQGRLWVASSEVYPQIKPGQEATDKMLVLEDTDGDGKADKSEVFADGLLIPTGVLPGDGGGYVANSTDLLHLSRHRRRWQGRQASHRAQRLRHRRHAPSAAHATLGTRWFALHESVDLHSQPRRNARMACSGSMAAAFGGSARRRKISSVFCRRFRESLGPSSRSLGPVVRHRRRVRRRH